MLRIASICVNSGNRDASPRSPAQCTCSSSSARINLVALLPHIINTGLDKRSKKMQNKTGNASVLQKSSNKRQAGADPCTQLSFVSNITSVFLHYVTY
ncbi:hypothetical protein RB195_006275 [Necator americanus]